MGDQFDEMARAAVCVHDGPDGGEYVAALWDKRQRFFVALKGPDGLNGANDAARRAREIVAEIARDAHARGLERARDIVKAREEAAERGARRSEADECEDPCCAQSMHTAMAHLRNACSEIDAEIAKVRA